MLGALQQGLFRDLPLPMLICDRTIVRLTVLKMDLIILDFKMICVNVQIQLTLLLRLPTVIVDAAGTIGKFVEIRHHLAFIKQVSVNKYFL